MKYFSKERFYNGKQRDIKAHIQTQTQSEVCQILGNINKADLQPIEQRQAPAQARRKLY